MTLFYCVCSNTLNPLKSPGGNAAILVILKQSPLLNVANTCMYCMEHLISVQNFARKFRAVAGKTAKKLSGLVSRRTLYALSRGRSSCHSAHFARRRHQSPSRDLREPYAAARTQPPSVIGRRDGSVGGASAPTSDAVLPPSAAGFLIHTDTPRD